MFRQILTLAIMLWVLFGTMQAQLSEKFFNRIGLTLMTEAFTAPTNKFEIIVNNAKQEAEITYFGLPVINVAYEPRYNLVEFGDNFALSADLGVAFGLSILEFKGSKNISGSGGFHITTPLMLKLYGGAGSTYSTANSAGFNIGFGLQSIFAPLFVVDGTDIEKQNIPRFYIQPLIGGGASWWMGDRLLTINFSGWLGNNNDVIYRSYYAKLELIYTFDY
jgi:hypothetical protein